MSIRQPKPKQIRLPFNVPKPKKGVDPPARVCGICKQKDSRYTCPRCNVAYCSLACFRDPNHAQCSEPFYRSTVMEQLASDPDAEFEEKKKMLEMLRRFEDAQAEGSDAIAALEAEFEGENEDDEDELAAKLDGVDLDDIDSNALFHLLPQSHRDAFLAAIQDPSSAAARELLDEAAATGGEGVETGPPPPTVLPWWETEDDLIDDDEAERASMAERCAVAPLPVDGDVTVGIQPPDGVGIKLAHNLVFICIAYIHTLLSLRLPSLASSYLSEQDVTLDEVRGEISHLVPFLIEPRSTVRYESVRDAWGAVWESIGKDSSPGPAPPTSLLIRLLESVAPLLHPPITTDPPKLFLVVSDLYRLFAVPKPGSAVPRKLAFYLAAMRQMTRHDWLALERELRREVEKLGEETAPDEPVPAPASGTSPGASITLI